MLYFASYFEPQHQHGLKLSISRSVPKNIKIDGKIEFLVPTAELLAAWKAKQIDQTEYTKSYREQVKHSWDQVKAWLDSLNPKVNASLLCWERRGEFCHRGLVALLVQKYRPECFGGCDVIRVEAEQCPDCNTKLVCGLDYSYCPTCKTWLERRVLEKKLGSKAKKK